MTRCTNALNEKPEPELIAEARDGDRDAMAELFRRHYPHSIATARRILPAQEEFLDAVQSAYLSAFQNFQSFREEASFKTWITRIVLNKCLTRLREPGRRRIVLSLDRPGRGGRLPVVAAHSPTPEDLGLRAEIYSVVVHAATELSKPQRDVFTRCSISGLSIRDTAEALGLTVPATKIRLFRARCLMRQKLRAAFAGRLKPLRSRIASERKDKAK
jgi:RNA polymerase sigma-70 factor (ECF subfamily)